MNLGSVLKDIRKNLGLTQEEMAGDIISASQYSRIESGKQDLRVNDLLKIIKLHNLNSEYLFNRVLYKSEINADSSEICRTCLEKEISKNYYDQDIDNAKILKDKISKEYNSDELKIRMEILTAVVEGRAQELRPDLKRKIYRHLIESENWFEDPMSLRLFAFSTTIFDFKQLSLFLNEILNHYEKIDKVTILQQKYIAIICISYLKRCWDEKIVGQERRPIDWLNSLPKLSEFFMFKLLGKYYKACFEKNKDEIRKIKETLNMMDYDGLL